MEPRSISVPPDGRKNVVKQCIHAGDRSGSMPMRPSDSTAFLEYLPEVQLARQMRHHPQVPECLEQKPCYNQTSSGERLTHWVQ